MIENLLQELSTNYGLNFIDIYLNKSFIRRKIMLSSLVASLGEICSKAVSTFTWLWFADEPKECPQSLIN